MDRRYFAFCSSTFVPFKLQPFPFCFIHSHYRFYVQRFRLQFTSTIIPLVVSSFFSVPSLRGEISFFSLPLPFLMICSWTSSLLYPIVVNQPFNRFLIAVAAATSNLAIEERRGEERKGITLLQKWSNSVTEMTRIKDGAALMTYFYDYHRRLLSSMRRGYIIFSFLFFSTEKKKRRKNKAARSRDTRRVFLSI